jgi:lysophospholipase L1-like esterase
MLTFLRLSAALTAAVSIVACSRDSTTGPTPLPEPNSTINYTSIGASDTMGIGSSVECLPLIACPNGKGYVQEATRQLQSRGFTVALSNLGFPSAVISRHFQDLPRQFGRVVPLFNILEQEAPFVPANSTLVTIFTGPNDVNTVTSSMGAGAGASDQIGFINAQIAQFGSDFSTLLQMIRERAPGVRIVAMNLPNMAGIPMLANASLQQRQAAQRLSVGFTQTVINPSTTSGVLVIDLMCDSRSYQASTYSSDGFHPSDVGYAWMAAEVVAAATTNYRSPSASCPSMSLVP